jgi:hypothetical protein
MTVRLGGTSNPAPARPKPSIPAVAVRAKTDVPDHLGCRWADAEEVRADPPLPAILLSGEEENERPQALPKRLANCLADMQKGVCTGQ